MFDSIRFLVPLAVCAFSALCLAAPASAQEYCGASDWARVVELSGSARSLMEKGRYDDALEKLEQAYSLCPDPKLDRSIGKVYLAAGRDREALVEFESCVKSDLPQDVRDECRKLAAEASGMIDRTGISLVGAPPEATVIVDGVAAGVAGDGLVKAAAGTRRVEVRMDGLGPFSAETVVERGRFTPVTVEFAAPEPVIPDKAVAAVEPELVDGLEAAADEAPGGQEVTADEQQILAEDEADEALVQPDATVGARTDFTGMGGSSRKADAFAPETVPNWVGVGLGAAALGVGIGFLAQYGMDVKDVEENPIEEGQGGYWEREVGITNVAVGASFTAAGVIAVVLSAALWPDARVKPAIAAAPGGGVVGFTVGL